MPSLGAVELLILLVVLVLPVVVVLWLVARARTRAAGYRALAEQSVAATQANERRLDEIAAELAGMRDQLASLQRVLSEVE